MKKLFTLISFFMLLLYLTSCSHKMYNQPNCTAVASGDTVIFSNKTDLQTTLTKITDSRCPKGVTCVWAGTVSVDIRINDDFSMLLEIGKPTEIIHNEQKYSFTLVDVVPYPGASSEPPVAIIRIIKN
jgi:hypothetical protein